MDHWWFWQIYQSPAGIAGVFSWSFWVILSVTLHELAHGISAMKCGDDTPARTGHMTWNPVVHMGISGVIMFVLMGVTWGAMPVSPSRFRGRYDDARVAAAGPMTNLWLAALSIVLGAVWAPIAAGIWFPTLDVTHALAVNVTIFFRLGAVINLVLVPLNLMPIPPLDGSRILANFSTWYSGVTQHPHARSFAMVAMVLIFLYGGNVLWPWAFDVVDRMQMMLVRWMVGPMA